MNPTGGQPSLTHAADETGTNVGPIGGRSGLGCSVDESRIIDDPVDGQSGLTRVAEESEANISPTTERFGLSRAAEESVTNKSATNADPTIGQSALIYRLLAGAFLCFVLAGLFYDLYVAICGDYPHGFHTNDLAWMVLYIFFFSISLRFYDSFSKEEQKTARSYLPVSALIAFVIFVTPYAVSIYIGGEAFRSGCFAAGTYAAAVCSLDLFIAAVLGGVRFQARYYHLAVLIYLAADAVMNFCYWSVSDGPVYYMYTVAIVTQTFLPFIMLRTVMKGWENE
jgi:hypothetical protein